MVFPILRLVLALLFMASAVLKLFPVDAFELILIRQLDVSWAAAPYLSRALILFEFLLGAFLLFGTYLRWSLIIGITALCAFTVHLLILLVTGRGGENCGCFGELLPMDAMTSVFKNLGFLVLALLVLFRSGKAARWTWSYGAWIISLLAIPALFVFFPLPEAIKFEAAKMDRAVLEQAGVLEAADEPSAVLILYAECIHCKQIAELVATGGDARERLLIVLYGDEERVDRFVQDTHLQDFPHVHTADRSLLAAFNGTFPTLVQLEHGKVTGVWQGDNITKSLLSRLMD